MNTLSKIFKGDKGLWFIFLFFCIISLIEVFSAGSRLTFKSGNYWIPLRQHASFLFCGFLLVLFVSYIPYRKFQYLSVFLLPVSLILLIWALVAGHTVNDASRWVPIFGIKFQPSELAKMAMVIYSAFILKKQKDGGASPYAFKFIVPVFIVFFALILPENLSTAGLLFLEVMLMMFIGRIPIKKIGILIGALLSPVIIMILIVAVTPKNTIANDKSFLHRAGAWVERFDSFLSDRDKVPAERYDISKKEQVGHASIAIATSNLLGKGPGNSVQRDFLSEAESDFIFAIIIEEMGLFGGMFVVLLYIWLLVRAYKIAKKCGHHYFAVFLVIGIALMIVSQALVNMMVAVGLFPVTGQPLPLISKGGTSTLINCVYIGMMLSVSRYANSLEKQNRADKDKEMQLEIINQSPEPTEDMAEDNIKIE